MNTYFSTRKKIIFSLLALVVLALVAISWSNEDKRDASEILIFMGDEPIKGNKDALVTLFVYQDYQCPACANFSKIIKKIWPDIKEEVRLVYRHFPLPSIHKHAILAAKYTQAVYTIAPDRFWTFADQLYNTQYKWSKSHNPSDFFNHLLKNLNVSVAAVEGVLDSEEILAAIAKNRQEAIDLQLTGTPSAFMNNIPVRQFQPDILKKEILEYVELLKNSPQK